MEELKKKRSELSKSLVLILGLLFCAVASADWNPGDPCVFCQLPNPTGWDVYSEWGTGPFTTPPHGYGASNDWTATQTCSIYDIHFWGSWEHDIVGVTGKILLQIFDNDTQSGSFARPGHLLWDEVINTNEYTTRLYTTGTQGWYDPRGTDSWQSWDHQKMYQYNINLLQEPFVQEAGHTYWLMISMDYQGCNWGWKTTNSVKGNPSVFWDTYDIWGPHPYCYWSPTTQWKWTQLTAPQGYCYPRTPLDLAFVLTVPEPATIVLLALGGLLLRKRH